MAKCEKIVLVKIHTYVFMVEKNGLRCLFGGVLDLTGCGLARPAIFAVPHGPARHEKWPTGPCLGRRPGPQADEARPAGHGVPPWPGSHRAMPGRAGPMPRYGGCPDEAKVFNPNIEKLDSKTFSCHFIGYPDKSKGYRFYCPDRHTK